MATEAELNKLKRTELDEKALDAGLDPADYSKKEDLAAALADGVSEDAEPEEQEVPSTDRYQERKRAGRNTGKVKNEIGDSRDSAANVGKVEDEGSAEEESEEE